MIKPFDGFKAEANRASGYEMLPAGPYIGRIMVAAVEGTEPDQRLVLDLEITEGPYTGYYTNRYDHEKAQGGQYEVKYRGKLRIQIPNDANTKAKFPVSDKKRFEDSIYRIEQSNPGYHWNWNEQSLNGLAIGFSVQEGTFKDRPYTKPARLETVQDIRDGNVTVMPPMKPRGDSQGAVDAATGMPVVSNEELPF